MTLKDNLYTIVGKTEQENGFSYQIRLNPDCDIYKAHFPNQPITPGVCILQLVHELFADAVGKTLVLDCIKNAKFLSVLKPEGQTVCVTLSNIKEVCVASPKITTDQNSLSAQSVVADLNGTIYAKISIFLRQ